ncbi:MAG TPA: lycopene cyclase family protein [Bacteroidales bacterium]|nr:lycopene cyclase family protein [Bacteroidales bacterium]
MTSRFSKLAFHSSHHSEIYDLQDYRYHVIRGIDFYRFIKEQLAKLPNFEFLNSTVQGIQDNPDGGLVNTTDGNFGAKWVFSSIFNESEVLRATQSKLYLRQHFKGWFIKTRVPVFNPGVFSMFDFRTPQSGVMRFFM